MIFNEIFNGSQTENKHIFFNLKYQALASSLFSCNK